MKNKMYWIDANILVRFFTKDSILFYEKSEYIIKNSVKKGHYLHLNTLVLHEVIYVLNNLYKIERNTIAKKIKKLIAIENFILTDIQKAELFNALDDYKNLNVDFSDCIYKQICFHKGYKLLSFDKDFRKLAIKANDKL